MKTRHVIETILFFCFLAPFLLISCEYLTGSREDPPVTILDYVLTDNGTNLHLETDEYERLHLPPGMKGIPYSIRLLAEGGNDAYSWEHISGSIVPGLALSGNGIISGVPVEAASVCITITVVSGSSEDDREFCIRTCDDVPNEMYINDELVVEGEDIMIPDGVWGVPYEEVEILIIGNSGPYNIFHHAGAFNPGMTVEMVETTDYMGKAVIKGTPVGDGLGDGNTVRFTIRATDIMHENFGIDDLYLNNAINTSVVFSSGIPH